MISKQGLWFLTLFSLILVLSVYYITMPNELLLTNNQQYNEKVSKDDEANVEVEESDYLTSLRVDNLDKIRTEIKSLQEVLTSVSSTVEEKCNAYEQIKYLNSIRSKEEKLEAKIKDEIKKDVFIKMENDNIKVVVASKIHSHKIANDIMRSIQAEFDEKKHISVKFQA
jgi:stage III sporulation protein AH